MGVCLHLNLICYSPPRRMNWLLSSSISNKTTHLPCCIWFIWHNKGPDTSLLLHGCSLFSELNVKQTLIKIQESSGGSKQNDEWDIWTFVTWGDPVFKCFKLVFKRSAQSLFSPAVLFPIKQTNTGTHFIFHLAMLKEGLCLSEESWSCNVFKNVSHNFRFDWNISYICKTIVEKCLKSHFLFIFFRNVVEMCLHLDGELKLPIYNKGSQDKKVGNHLFCIKLHLQLQVFQKTVTILIKYSTNQVLLPLQAL